MSMTITEDFSSGGKLKVSWNKKDSNKIATKEGMNDSQSCSAPLESVITEYEALHVRMTRNFTYYTDNCLKSSVESWTYPYPRPIIMHHNEKDGKIIGRIYGAEYSDVDTLSGTGALKLIGHITDKDGKEGAIDGRLKTVSIGAIVHEAYCSICNQNIADLGECEHERGASYDDELCYWRIENMEAKELSYVIVPSDIYAQHTKVTKQQENGSKIKLTESMEGKRMPGENKKPEEQVDYVAEIEKLKQAIATKESENAELLTAKEELEVKLVETQELANTANKEIETVKETFTTTEAALKEEVNSIKATLETKEAELRSIEDGIISQKANERSKLVESISTMRTALGKRTITKEELNGKSEEYLKEYSLDLTEEMSIAKKVITTEEGLTNPGIVNTEKVSVKEEKKNSNINVEESIIQMMNGLMTPNRI